MPRPSERPPRLLLPPPGCAVPAEFTVPRPTLFGATRVVLFGTSRVERSPAPPPELPAPFFPRVPVALFEPPCVVVRSPPPFAFCRLVPPPRLLPLVPPREFDPVLLLGVALGITPCSALGENARAVCSPMMRGKLETLIAADHKLGNKAGQVAAAPPVWQSLACGEGKLYHGGCLG